MTFVEIDVDAWDAIDLVQFEAAQLRSDNLARWLRNRAAPWFKQRARMRFDAEGDQAVGKWAPLRPVTEWIRVFEGFPAAHPINVRTGNLRGWLTTNDGFTNEYGYGAKLTWPTPPPAGELASKYKTAQVGGKVKVGNNYRTVVPRPVVGADQTDLQFLLSGLQSWLKI